MNIEGRKFTITGGAGFVGSHLADALLAAGANRVVVIDNLVRGSHANVESAQATGRFALIEGDIRDADAVEEACRGADAVFHLAALRITACAQDPRSAHAVMMDGTFNVLEACARQRIPRIIASSSASVYGEPTHLPIDEEHPFNNRTLYGAAKVGLEQYLRSFREMYGLSYAALRYFNLYGPRMDMTGVYTEVMVRWLDRIEAGLPPVVFGTGQQSMDFVYVTDAVRANLAALATDIDDEIFNVATGVETTLVDLARLITTIAGRNDLDPEFKEARQIGPVGRRRGDPSKASTLLGFTAEVSLRDGLELLLAWRKSQRGQ